MENDRILELIRLLKECADPVSGEILAAKLRISRRTLIKDIQACNLSMHETGIKIISMRRKGYQGIILDKAKLELFLNSNGMEQRSLNLESDMDYRKRQLRAALALQDSPLSVNALSEIIHVTPNVIFSYLKTFRENNTFSRFNLKLVTLPKRGIELEGEEFYKRFYVIHTTIKLEYTNLTVSAVHDLDILFNDPQAEEIRNFLITQLEFETFAISDYSAAWLVCYLLLAQNRISKGQFCRLDICSATLKATPEYHAAAKIGRHFFASQPEPILFSEILGLTVLLLLYNEKNYTLEELMIYGEYTDKAKHFLHSINTSLKKDFNFAFTSVKHSESVMLNVLLRLVFYFEFGLEKISVQPVGLRGYYPRVIQDPVICELARYAQQVTLITSNKKMWSFTTTLLAQMFETVITLIPCSQPLNAALLVGEGMVYGEGILTYLQRNFPTMFARIDFIHSFDVRNQNFQQYDLVLTTASPSAIKSNIPTFKIPFFAEENFSYLAEIIPTLVKMQKMKAFKNLEIKLSAQYLRNYHYTNKQLLISQIFYAVTDSWDALQQKIQRFAIKDKIKKYNPMNEVLFIFDMEADANESIVFVQFDNSYKWYEYTVKYVLYLSYNPAGNLIKLKFMHLLFNELASAPVLIDEIMQKQEKNIDLIQMFELISFHCPEKDN
ncbi:HTH domain-containing protein [Holdemania massiliensis]|uniref:HTH domain-containing protein n=1 Tax=Holdemania massiliensis TaxID=1468449 RepID=UPI001F0588F7|nr:HTH domain-containing protein [Holdemania massiliensis]MCH1942310.1 HTH domain-containing protein [Holdemania massiliensis]